MVAMIPVVLAFLVSGVCTILGARTAFKLSKHINYPDGFYKLWIVTQSAVMSSKKLDYVIDENDLEGTVLFINLKRTIIVHFSLLMPLLFIAFLLSLLGL